MHFEKYDFLTVTWIYSSTVRSLKTRFCCSLFCFSVPSVFRVKCWISAFVSFSKLLNFSLLVYMYYVHTACTYCICSSKIYLYYFNTVSQLSRQTGSNAGIIRCGRTNQIRHRRLLELKSLMINTTTEYYCTVCKFIALCGTFIILYKSSTS